MGEEKDGLCWKEFPLPFADPDPSLLDGLASLSLHLVSLFDRFLVIWSTPQIRGPNNTLTRTRLPAVTQLPGADLRCVAYTGMAHLATITLTLSYWFLGLVMASDRGDGIPFWMYPFWTYRLTRLFPPFQLCYLICVSAQHGESREERPHVQSEASASRTATFLSALGSPAAHDVLFSSGATKHF